MAIEVARRDSQALLEAVRALSPRIEAAGPKIEHDRRLPAPLLAELVDAGLLRMLVPQSLGGGEVSLPAFAEIIEEVARADGSTAWCLCQGAVAAMVSAFLPERTANGIFGEPATIIAWGPGPTATARAVDDGYRVSGEWSFASGCHHATWLGGNCALVDETHHPVLGGDGTAQRRLVLFPVSEAEFTDVWHVSGLQGTGSDSYQVTNLFVPGDHAVSVPLACPREQGPLYRFVGGPSFVSTFAIGFGAVALGLAGATLDAFLDLASTKTPRGIQGLLREQPMTQAQVGEADAILRSARAFLHQSVAEVWEAVCRSGELTMSQRVLIRLATTHAIQCGAQVVRHGLPCRRCERDLSQQSVRAAISRCARCDAADPGPPRALRDRRQVSAGPRARHPVALVRPRED